MRICVSVQGQTAESAAELMEKAFTAAPMVELRIDAMKDPCLPALLRPRGGEIIVTNRRREEGGGFDGPESLRVKILETAVRLGADYVDIEASTDGALIAGLQRQIERFGSRTQLILSWHDFTGTPTEARLRAKFREMAAIAPGIVKMVPTAWHTTDNLRVLNLIPYAQRRGREIIAFAMGEAGRPSRIASPLLGGYLAFASLAAGAESAPGQLTVAQMNQIGKMALL